MAAAGTLRRRLDALPAPARQGVRGAASYARRVALWRRILVEVRGAGRRDRIALLTSAFASLVTASRDLSRWQDPTLRRDASVRVPSVGSFELRARTDDLWHVLPHRERPVMAEIQRLLRPGDTFVDAGANIGFFTVMASRLVGDSGRVIAVEMMPDTASRLRHHVARNGAANVEIVEVALADRSGGSVTARVQVGKFGQASIARLHDEGAARELQVPTATLDDVVGDTGPIRLMKMDLEGAEERAVVGAVNALDRTHALIYEERSDAPDAVAARLRDLGFALRQLDGGNWLAYRQERSVPAAPAPPA